MNINRILGTALTSTILLIPTDKAQRVAGGVIHNAIAPAKITAKFVGERIYSNDIANAVNTTISGRISSSNSIGQNVRICGAASNCTLPRKITTDTFEITTGADGIVQGITRKGETTKGGCIFNGDVLPVSGADFKATSTGVNEVINAQSVITSSEGISQKKLSTLK